MYQNIVWKKNNINIALRGHNNEEGTESAAALILQNQSSHAELDLYLSKICI